MGFRLFRLTSDEIETVTFLAEDDDPDLAARLSADWKGIRPCSRDDTIEAYGLLVKDGDEELAKKIRVSNKQYEREKRPTEM